MKNPSLRKVLLSWLMHFGVVWVLSNLFNVTAYLINLSNGYYQNSHNGTPLTVWQYFLKHNIYQPDMIWLAMLLAFVEFNYQYVFYRFKLWQYLISCTIISIIPFYILLQLHPNKLNIQSKSILHTDVTPLLILITYMIVYALIRDYFYQKQYKKELQLQQSENELKALKAQLNPHFLFNSLNYLYGTALKEEAPLTADGVDRLSQMMRYTITGLHHNFVPVNQELTFIEHYIAMQLVRLPQKENITIDAEIINPVPQSLEIAPLLLLPFIENAFKYGISMDKPCAVSIHITLTKNELTMQVQNQIFMGITHIEGNNTGIKNTVKRLQLLYPNSHRLNVQHSDTHYKVSLTVDLNSIKS